MDNKQVQVNANFLKEKYDNFELDICPKEISQTIIFLFVLGFPLKEFGTYLYANVIYDLIKRLEEGEDKDKLVKQLADMNSELYIKVSKQDNNMNLEEFHNCMKEIFSKINVTVLNIFLNFWSSCDYETILPILVSEIAFRILEEVSELNKSGYIPLGDRGGIIDPKIIRSRIGVPGKITTLHYTKTRKAKGRFYSNKRNKDNL